ncbi:MAG: PEP-CTERM sorting domain-containing protein [Pseudomonadota bacterium]
MNILWLSGTDTYNDSISELAAGGLQDASLFDPNGDGSNTWTIDFWSSGVPDFSTYDALVIGSTCRPACGGSNGFFNLGVQPDLVLANGDAIAAARGDRTFVSGQDADWHYQNDSSLVDRSDARGFLVNAVNWAASGTGLGIVVLADGFTGSNNGWLSDPLSFLAPEIGGARINAQQNTVVIPDAESAAFPINEGLNNASLSGWGTSSHTAFRKADLPADTWRSINDFATAGNPLSVTIVTAATAGGGTIPDPDPIDPPPVDPVDPPVSVPEPDTFALLLLGLAGLRSVRRRQLTA